MILRDLSLYTPEENILFDEVLFSLAEKGQSGEILRFWEITEPCIVLGKTSKEQDDIFLDYVLEDHIKVLRRCSGGGTVYQGKGCLNYSVILSKQLNPPVAHLQQSYEFIVGKIIRALASIGVQAEFKPISDIALKSDHKKISGNAQKRGKHFILHHGTILYDLDFKKIEYYLRMPQSVPAYRQGRAHQDFMANVSAGVEDLKKSIRNVFDIHQAQNILSAVEQEALKDFLKTKNPLVSSCDCLLLR